MRHSDRHPRIVLFHTYICLQSKIRVFDIATYIRLIGLCISHDAYESNYYNTRDKVYT